MSGYESQPGVEPVRIVTFARVRKAARQGVTVPDPAPTLLQNFFSYEARSDELRGSGASNHNAPASR